MAEKVRIWYDAEADFLEVRFSRAAGYEKATKNDAVMERVNRNGKVIGFSILGVSRFKKAKPLKAVLTMTAEELRGWGIYEQALAKPEGEPFRAFSLRGWFTSSA